MSSAPTKRRRAGLGIAAFVAVFAVVGTLMLFRPLQPPGDGINPETIPVIGVTQLGDETGGAVLNEQAEMFDPTPLFLPTRWNTSQQPLPWDVAKRPGERFESFGSKQFFMGSSLAIPVYTPPAVPENSVDALRRPENDPFFAFGSMDIPSKPLHARAASLEVAEARTGAKRGAESIGVILMSDGWRDWAPVEYFILIGASGLIGEPLVNRSSGVEEVDAFFKEYLANTYRVGSRFAPGMYKVLIGP